MFSKKNNLAQAEPYFEDESLYAVEEDNTWTMLIVDDEPDIHKVTEMALRNVKIEEKSLIFLNAYSAAEAKEILIKHDNIALILLDVVMETNHAGLDLAKYIRNELNNKLTRIVLRTGQPGEAPEEKVFVDYDINDYKEKTELDRKRLFTTVYSSIRAYRDLMRIEESRKYLERNRAGLEKVIHSSARLFEARSIAEFASGLLEQISSVLFINNDSMILSSQGVTAVGDDPEHWEIVSTNGALSNADNTKIEEINDYLNEACKQQQSIFIDNRFIGYFKTKSHKITLIYIEGCEKLDELNKSLLDIFSMNITIAFENINLEKEVADTQSEIIIKLGEVLESRSRETGNHVKRLALLSAMLAKQIGLSDEECKEILHASPMHDIGKIAIPDAILLKPGRFTPDEFEKMKYHAEAGYQMLNNSSRSVMKSAALIAWQHHEHYDGNGYPNAISGEEIHIFSRIVAIVDVFDALMNKRCYKEPWTLEQTVDVLKQGRGKQFDPNLIDAFFEIMPEAVLVITEHADVEE